MNIHFAQTFHHSKYYLDSYSQDDSDTNDLISEDDYEQGVEESKGDMAESVDLNSMVSFPDCDKGGLAFQLTCLKHAFDLKLLDRFKVWSFSGFGHIVFIFIRVLHKYVSHCTKAVALQESLSSDQEMGHIHICVNAINHWDCIFEQRNESIFTDLLEAFIEVLSGMNLEKEMLMSRFTQWSCISRGGNFINRIKLEDVGVDELVCRGLERFSQPWESEMGNVLWKISALALKSAFLNKKYGPESIDVFFLDLLKSIELFPLDLPNSIVFILNGQIVPDTKVKHNGRKNSGTSVWSRDEEEKEEVHDRVFSVETIACLTNSRSFHSKKDPLFSIASLWFVFLDPCIHHSLFMIVSAFCTPLHVCGSGQRLKIEIGHDYSVSESMCPTPVRSESRPIPMIFNPATETPPKTRRDFVEIDTQFNGKESLEFCVRSSFEVDPLNLNSLRAAYLKKHYRLSTPGSNTPKERISVEKMPGTSTFAVLPRNDRLFLVEAVSMGNFLSNYSSCVKSLALNQLAELLSSTDIAHERLRCYENKTITYDNRKARNTRLSTLEESELKDIINLAKFEMAKFK